MFKKLWSAIKRYPGWFFSVTLFLFALAFFPSVSAIIFLVAGVIILPVKKLQNWISKYLPKKIFKSLIAGGLFVVACCVAPQTETTNNAEIPVDGMLISETATDTFKDADVENTTEGEQPVSTEESQEDSPADAVESETEQETESPQGETTEETNSSSDSESSEIFETAEEEIPPSETTLNADPIPNEPSQELEEPITSSFSITYLDVGQADAAVVECDGQYMFIDTGNAADSNLIFSYIRGAEIETVEYVLLTHYHEDHIGGAQAIPRAATVNTLLVNNTTPTSDLAKETVDYYKSQDIPVEMVAPGDIYMLGSASIEIYGPIGTYDDVNDTSIVLKIIYGNTSFLFTGDAENISEADIIDADYDIHCNVLKIGHHGSASSTSSAWLKAVDPTYAVISVGEGNGNGHPTGEVLTRLRQAGIVTYRTDLQGDIVCVSDGENITFNVEKNATADTLAENNAGDYAEEVIEETPPAEEKQQDTNAPVDNGKDYVVNKNTKKYHKPTCSSADEIKPYNRWDYHGTADELEAMGYEPCGRCKPY